MDLGSFIVFIKRDDIYKDITDDVETKFDNSIYTLELDRPLPKKRNKRFIGLMKDRLSGKIKKEFVALRAKTYIYLRDNGSEDKKAKTTKKCFMKT